MTDPALLATFEERFRTDPDPWNFDGSGYEERKRAATLRACGTLAGAHVLELGAANGVLASCLAPDAASLTAIEAVPAAAALARERLAGFPGARVVEGLVPFDVPAEAFDVVVASEILYYLAPATYATTLRRLGAWLVEGGRLVAVHWRPTSAERPRSAQTVHEDLARLPALALLETADTDDYLLSVLERRRA